MENVLVIVAKNGTKYQIGIDKSVVEVLNEINAVKGDFYQVHQNCAIRKDQIVSVEHFEFDPKEVAKQND